MNISLNKSGETRAFEIIRPVESKKLQDIALHCTPERYMP